MTVDLMRVMTKATKYHPASKTEFSVFQSANSIAIYKDDKTTGFPVRCRSFDLGEYAEYGSYNLSYSGVITKITAKCVTIQAYPGTRSAENHRLALYEFCYRNYNYDHAKATARNHEEMMYI